jgi:hypothetical protein
MRSAVMCWVLVGVGALMAQPPLPIVRSINFRPISTTSKGLHAFGPEEIAAAWKSKGIDLAVERRYDPAAVEKAANAIRDMYGDEGQRVRVEYIVAQIPPRSLQISFEINQLCTCN